MRNPMNIDLDEREQATLIGLLIEVGVRALACRHGVPLLRDVNLRIARGEVVALVGSSGAGKSTLANLIPRFFDVTGGRVLIDGHNVRDVTLKSLRAQIGMVTQETILFNDTVSNNICYGRTIRDTAAMEEAARTALAHEFITEMPEGYETVIGERGITNVHPMRASLTDFSLPEQVDVVFSNAVFHWIPDDEGLFGCLSKATGCDRLHGRNQPLPPSYPERE